MFSNCSVRRKTVTLKTESEKVLEGKQKSFGVVVVTGGSSGIGKYFVHRLRMLESCATICNLSRTKPEDFFHDPHFHHFECDLGKPDQLQSATKRVVNQIENCPGRILLVNNSGFGAYGVFPNPNLEEHLEMIDLNVKAVVHLTALLLPLLEKRGGAIVNIASTAAFLPTPYMATYGATKAFLLNWGLALGEELKEKDVTVLTVCPGPTKTRFYKRAGFNEPVVSKNLELSVEEVVEVSLRAVRKQKKLAVPGVLNKILVALAARLPRPFTARIAERILRKYRLPN